MSGASQARTTVRFYSLCVALFLAGSVAVSPAAAFEAFDGRIQAHGFYEMQLRALNGDYSEEWDVSQWYHVFNLELELDLLDETVGIVDLVSAFVRAEVRYDCIYSRGCGMFRSMNAFGDRSKSLPRRLSNATTNVSAGEIPIRTTSRLTGNTDPVPLSEVAGFSGLADSDGQEIPGSESGCGPGQKPGVDCFPDGQLGIKPFDYTFEQFSEYRFTMVNVSGGGASGNPTQILGPWLPKNRLDTTIGSMTDRVNPFDNSRLNPVLNCDSTERTGNCVSGFKVGDGGKPFRPIPIYAEDRSRAGPEKISVVVYQDDTNPALSDPDNPAVYQELEIDSDWNGGDARFSKDGKTPNQYVMVRVRFPGDDPNKEPPLRIAYGVGDTNRQTSVHPTPNENYALLNRGDALVFQTNNQGVITDEPVPFGKSAKKATDARGLFLPSKPLREIMDSNKLSKSAWPLNLSESKRQWNRGLSQKDEKELKEAYFDIELFDSQLWIRAGKQTIVWGKTELFRTTDQFNPTDLALATLPSLEESRIALWSLRGVWSFYEVGPLEDVRLEIAANLDDYESSDFGSCGEPYVVNLVCLANFGAFAHGFTGIGIVGVESVDNPWQSLKGWEVGARLEWRWDRFSFQLSDFWGYADLPAVRRLSTYERNTDAQTGRPLVYQGFSPKHRREERTIGYARDCFKADCSTFRLSDTINAAFPSGNSNDARIGRSNDWDDDLLAASGGDDPWDDPYGDLIELIKAQKEDPKGSLKGRLPGLSGAATSPGFLRVRDVDPTRAQVDSVSPGNPSAGFLVRSQVTKSSRKSCGTSREGGAGIRYDEPGSNAPSGALQQGLIDQGDDCLTQGPSQIFNTLSTSGTKAIGRLSSRGFADPTSPLYQPTNALDSHHANLTLFTWICSATVGFLEIDTTACAPTVFGSTQTTNGVVIAEALGLLLAGSPALNNILTTDSTATGPNVGNAGSATNEFAMPIVLLSSDRGDNSSLGRFNPVTNQYDRCFDYQTRDGERAGFGGDPCGGTNTDSPGVATSLLALELSPEQEALLGCGPFWGTNCDSSGIDLLNMEGSAVLQSFSGANGTLESIKLKEAGYSYPGTEILDPVTGQVAAFRAPSEYRTDEGLQPGTLPWEASGIGGPICTTSDIGGDLPNRAGDTMRVPGNKVPVQRPGTRKQILPGCHRKWVDKQNGYLNLAWGQPLYADADGDGNLDVDKKTGLPIQARNASGDVLVDYFYQSGDPDPLGVKLNNQAVQADGRGIYFPTSVRVQQWASGPNNPIFSNSRPAIGAGHPFAGRYAAGARTENLTVPFASELAGFSWNFQMVSVAFSSEFQNGVETVGDLADPAGANLKGGTRPPTRPNGIFDNCRFPNSVECNQAIAQAKRDVAQMLYGYCGSEYGKISKKTGLGDCRIDTANTAAITPTDDGQPIENDVPALQSLYFGLFRQGKFDPLAPPADVQRQRQEIMDSLQFVNVGMVEDVDATDDDTTDFEFNAPVTGEQNIIRSKHCSYVTPQYCSTVQNLYALAGVKNRTVAAGGNGTYGRRTLQWHSGGEITLYVPKRNVLGFAMDFTEDRTKTSFGVETTWIEGEPTGDTKAFDNGTTTNTFNMTVSVDRPTFVNFLNPNRTLFINSQWFFQYREGVKKSYGGNGPFSALATLTVFTGYFQDRLNPSLTFVHDIQSTSGGLLPSVNYRFSENFSATIGMAFFYGREQKTDIANNGIGPAGNQSGDWAYQTGGQNGISIVRDRDEAYLRLRYTF